MTLKLLPVLLLFLAACSGNRTADSLAENAFEAQKREVVDGLLLKDFQPRSIHNIQVTNVEHARFDVIDIHSHDYAKDAAEVDQWVKTLDKVGVKQVHLLNCNWIGEHFERMLEKYSAHKDRFFIWCCIDYTGFDKEGWAEHAIAELGRYRKLGAVGVGELVDKGFGDTYAWPVPGDGIHLDDPRLKPVIEQIGRWGMPINIHVAEPIWMYEPLDKHNDGLINGANWAIDTSQENIHGYEELMATFERVLKAYPGTTFIAAHYLNMNHDLERLSSLMDRYPNLWLDISGRLCESTVTPRATRKFILRHIDRIMFGTDTGMSHRTYLDPFRMLESDDEHVYFPDHAYHWSYSGLHLPDEALKKLYHDNAARLLNLQVPSENNKSI